jgi:hypothetical protein
VAEHWRRDKPQFFNVHALPWASGGQRLLDGCDTRVVSHDPDSADTTYMVRLVAGWRAVQLTAEAGIEFFVLEGDLSVEGRRVGAGGYAFLPPGSGEAELCSTTGAQALVFWNPSMRHTYGGELQVRRVWQEPWQHAEMPNTIHGAMFKSLRLPDPADGAVHGGVEGAVRLFLFTPGFSDPREHVHSVWEEMIYLTGDMMMPDRGVLAPGSYMGNPADFWHAPMICHQGAVLLFHNRDPIDMDLREYPCGEELADRYRDSASWLAAPGQREWSDMSEYHTAPSRIPT